MQSVQRHFGKYMKRSADESQISVLLKDFEDADQLLTRITDASQAWRDSWSSILSYQHRLMHEFVSMYAPIIGASDDYHGHQAAETPRSTISRTVRITEEYEELKKDLTEELNMVETRMIRPALDAKDSVAPMKKTIKKREDKKLDFERYQSRVDSARRKTKRSDRENAALAKAENDLARATEEYNAADQNLRQCLPRLITVVFSLLPHLLAAQIQIQNTLLAHYYTLLHNYCTDEKFPSPSPPMDEVVRIWEDDFKPVQREVEAIAILVKGKTVRSAAKLENGNGVHTNGFGRRPSGNSFGRAPSVSPARVLPPSPSDPDPVKPKITSLPSHSSSLLSPQLTSPSCDPSPSDYYTPMAFSPPAPRTDYFMRDRQPSSTSITSPAAMSAAIAAKKKPPPPPPRVPSQQFTWVTALYDFGGQGKGDLVFKEGDRIKVIKKTESTDDWWQGELRGVKGSFPANYCE